MARDVALVIFDCDGVLIDSERLAVRTEAQILAGLGWPLSEAEITERFVGRSQQYMHHEVERHLGHPIDWEADFTPRYREVFERELVPVDGVVDALDRISVATCVASSGSHEKMAFTLGITGLHHRFAGRIFSVDDVERGKPAPDVFLHAAREMGVEPARCRGRRGQRVRRPGRPGRLHGCLRLLRRGDPGLQAPPRWRRGLRRHVVAARPALLVAGRWGRRAGGHPLGSVAPGVGSAVLGSPAPGAGPAPRSSPRRPIGIGTRATTTSVRRRSSLADREIDLVVQQAVPELLGDDYRDQDDHLAVTAGPQLVDQPDDRPDDRRVVGVKDAAGAHPDPTRARAFDVDLGRTGGCPVDDHRDRQDLVPERHRLAEGVLGQPGDTGDRHHHDGRLATGRPGIVPVPISVAARP